MEVKFRICVITYGPFFRAAGLARNSGTNAGVAHYTNQHSASFRSKGIRMLLFSVLAHWRGTVV